MHRRVGVAVTVRHRIGATIEGAYKKRTRPIRPAVSISDYEDDFWPLAGFFGVLG